MKISPINLNAYKSAFRANYSKENNVTILGSSKSTNSYAVLDSMEKAAEISKHLVLSGKNILTGCGSNGVMGSAFYSAAKYSTKDENNRPEQNVVITKQPYWGDEDLENCIILDSAKSESERIEKFIETSDCFIIFPGGPATIQEATSIIASNHYAENKKRIVLVGKEYFKGLDEQYQKIYQSGLLQVRPSELYTLTDNVNEVIEKAQINS